MSLSREPQQPIVYDPSRADFPDRAYAIYRELRDHHPVHRDSEGDFWALTRFADVRDAAADAATFSSENTSISQGLLPMLQQLDPPRHDQLRNLLSRAFTPRRVAEMEPRVRQATRELIESFAGEDRCDFLHEFAAQMPSRVIGELIGIPPERRELFLRWTEAFISTNPKAAAGGKSPAGQIYREFALLLEERRNERRDDLMSALLDAEIDGERLSQDELLGFCFLLVIGGNDTTTNLLANGAVLLARHPEQRDALVRDPGLLPDAVEEMLRAEAPTQVLPRRTSRAVELHGVTIPTGSEVRLVWGAANHDDREFEDPERFDIARGVKRHLALGHGTHFCMGANLARLEARVAFEELLGQFPEFALAGDAPWQPSPWARAHAKVPLRLGPRSPI